MCAAALGNFSVSFRNAAAGITASEVAVFALATKFGWTEDDNVGLSGVGSGTEVELMVRSGEMSRAGVVLAGRPQRRGKTDCRAADPEEGDDERAGAVFLRSGLAITSFCDASVAESSVAPLKGGGVRTTSG